MVILRALLAFLKHFPEIKFPPLSYKMVSGKLYRWMLATHGSQLASRT